MSRKIQFGVYELDLDGMELHKHGVPIRLQEQPARVLVSLLQRPGEIVTRQELQAAIWPSDTFVEFDQSLNKAVNRLRTALHDDAAQPRYIETIPRRGYRFVAPVNSIASAQAQAIPPQVNGATSQSMRFRWLAGLGFIAVLLACVVAFGLLRKPEMRAQHVLTRVTRDGTSMFPELSRDGKLLAYCSSAGGDVAHVWVRQTAGGEPIQVTTGEAGESTPSFSPDATQIAFSTRGNGGGVYVIPSFGGEPRLVVKDAAFPKFSPDGESLLYLDTDRGFGAAVTPVRGGRAKQLDDQIPTTVPMSGLMLPIWSPTGKEFLYYGMDRTTAGQQPSWRISPLTGGVSRTVRFKSEGSVPSGGIPIAQAWTQTQDGQQWIVYSAAIGDSRGLFRVAISARGEISSIPERLTSGTVSVTEANLSQNGRLAFTAGEVGERIYVVPIVKRRGESGPQPLHLTGNEAIRNLSPSLSRDGRWMAYATTDENNSETKVRLKDLSGGGDRVIAQKHDVFDRDFLSISPDGSKVVFGQLEAGLSSRYHRSVISSYVVATAGGSPEKVCDFCLPRGFLSDNSAVLVQEHEAGTDEPDHIALLDLNSRSRQVFLSDASKPLYHAFFSWDDRWVVFKKLLRWGHGQLLIAPVKDRVAGQSAEWITVTDGAYDDDKPQFSSDGNTLYFTSDRDGYLCVWGVRLNRKTKQLEGLPYAVQHFHNDAGWYSAAYYHFGATLSVAGGKMAVNLVQPRSDIWMMNLQ